MYYDENPPSKAHWSYALFHKKINPETKVALKDPENYATLSMNPEHNRANLPADYIQELESLPERMKKRFLYGEYGDAAPNALFSMELFDQWRSREDAPQMVRVVVAIDPSGASEDDNQHNDEIGIIVAGLGIDGNAYVLEDLTCKAGPKTWGHLAVSAYDRHSGSCIVAETNYGGEMVKYVVQTSKPGVPFKKLTASKGKWVRAEPIAALVEQGKVRMAGAFHELEDELCAFTTTGYTGSKSPNRGDAFVWAITELFPGVIQQRDKDKPLVYGNTGIV
jgi:phage terminase large subunit-like protein